MKLLLTAFDPFAGDTINPALEAVKLVPNKIGRFEITLERVAINIDDARIKDSEGNQRSKPPCGSIKYIRTFVCNHLMYGVLYTLAKKYPHIKGWIYTCSFHTCTGSKKNTGSSIYGT